MMGVAASLIFDENNKILLAKRGYPEQLKGCWEFPGGKIEKEESAEEAIERELLEELNVEVTDLTKKASIVYSYSFEEISFEVFVAKLRSSKNRIELKDHDEITWVDPENLENHDLAPADKKIASQVL